MEGRRPDTVQPVVSPQKAVPSVPETDRPDQPPWWTEADQAELDALTRALVDGVFDHRPRCASCAREHPPCPHVNQAIEAVVEWRTAREVYSRARWLRLQREALDLQRDRARLAS